MDNNSLVLKLPEMKHREAVLRYINGFIASGEDIDGMGREVIPGSSLLDNYDAYGEWIYWLYGRRDDRFGDSSDKNSYTYFFTDEAEGEIVGTINIRPGGEEADKFGNLGYAVRPDLRGKGIGTMMVEAALGMCMLMGMDSVTAVCKSDNLPSIKVLKKCGFRIKESDESANKTDGGGASLLPHSLVHLVKEL